ncbi:MAG: hypothetical protein JWM33_1316 [Caulobacteraceae bacterium]|nr:hypothetical protein [Caulobacteraceae bacterium]
MSPDRMSPFMRGTKPNLNFSSPAGRRAAWVPARGDDRALKGIF